jgi:hypothetical protein
MDEPTKKVRPSRPILLSKAHQPTTEPLRDILDFSHDSKIYMNPDTIIQPN